MISCAEAVRRLWEYLERDLHPDDRERVEDHLAFCRRCCGELEFADALRGLLQAAARPHIPPEVESRLERVLGSLESEAR